MQFSVDITGRVKNFSLPTAKPLLPLFEAIVNSIHSIEERKEKDLNFKEKGFVNIELIREKLLEFDDLNTSDAPIIGFRVSDNGIGFTRENFRSFLTSDSIHKAAIGGKGVGRFSWLKAFEKVNVTSFYKENEQMWEREFDFSLVNLDIDDSCRESKTLNENLTTISLLNYYSSFQKSIAPIGHIDEIAKKIIYHCLVYLAFPNCPIIKLIDQDNICTVNDMFEQLVSLDENKTNFNIKESKFELLNLKINDPSIKKNKIYLCANNRTVKSINLDDYIVDLDIGLFSTHKFFYVGILTSTYLDDNVDMNRLSFNIPDSGDDLELYDITMKKIIEMSCANIELYLKDYLEPIREEKEKKILEYVTKEEPQFRHLIRHMPEAIKSIKPNADLSESLHKIKRAFDKKLKKDNSKLLEDLDQGKIDEKDYDERFRQQISKISDSNRAALAEYVAHRKIILNLLESGIRKNEDDKFEKEKYIHDLIYPMKTDSDSIQYDNHNLWLLDERLAYCSYIASDIPFNKKEERPDIVVLDNNPLNLPVAMSEKENDGTEFDSIVIFELKKPQRDDYSAGNNPIEQMYEYVDKIRADKVKEYNGRPIKAGDKTKFYLYAVCDITPSLKKSLKRLDNLTETPDGLGYFGYAKNYNAYIEVISFDKMINDSKKRNKILFDKLGL